MKKKHIDHTGLHSERLQHNPREQAFHDEWLDENTDRRGIDYGNGILQDLMAIRTGNKDRFNHMSGGAEEVFAEKINQRDARIVATIIQWLGSNIGMAFLSAALRRCGYDIVKLKKSDT